MQSPGSTLVAIVESSCWIRVEKACLLMTSTSLMFDDVLHFGDALLMRFPDGRAIPTVLRNFDGLRGSVVGALGLLVAYDQDPLPPPGTEIWLP